MLISEIPVADPDGALWCTLNQANAIGRIGLDGEFRHYDLPTPAAEPHGITVGADRTVWAVLEIGTIAHLA